MKRLLLILPVLLAACDSGGLTAPTAPTLPEGVSPTQSQSVETWSGSSLLTGTVSLATVTNCQGVGLIPSINLQYLICATDVSSGSGSVSFSDGGFAVALGAKSSFGAPEVVAAGWQSNGPVNATTGVCITISVTHLSLQGVGEVQEQLLLSYNGAPQAPLTWAVTATGIKTYCGTVPEGATNVWWSLVTVAGVPTQAPTADNGHRHLGGAKVSQSLLEVGVS
jgi:hypothetical protein